MNLTTVFLSSTGLDLAEHRRLLREAIRRLDGFHCVAMEEFGARDTASLEHCLSLIERSDVYVGLIGHRFGTSPEGQEQSFTMLEYEAAYARSIPRLLFVASEDFSMPANLAEKNAKLRRRQEQFRAKVKCDRVVEFFNEASGLALAVITSLSNWRATITVSPTADDLPALTSTRDESDADVAPGLEKAEEKNAYADKRIAAFSRALSDTGRDFADVIHAFLCARALIDDFASEALTVHQTQLCYKHRFSLHLSDPETRLLWRSLLSDPTRLRPGWYWLRYPEVEDPVKLLWGLFCYFRDATLHKNVLASMLEHDLDLPADSELRKAVIGQLLSLEDSSNLLLGLRLLWRKGELRDLPLLDAALVQKESINTRLCRLRIAHRDDDAAFFETAAVLEGLADAESEFLLVNLTNVKNAALVDTLFRVDSPVRAALAEQLRLRGALMREQAMTLYNDSTARTALVGAITLLDLGEPLSTAQLKAHFAERERSQSTRAGDSAGTRVLMHALRKLTYDELIEKLHWLSVDAELAYRVLLEEHFAKFAECARGDLADRFTGYRNRWKQRIRRQMVDEGIAAGKPAYEAMAEADGVLKSSEHLEDFVEGVFVDAALAGLCQHCEQIDLAIVREFMDQRKHAYYDAGLMSMIRYLRQCGDADDRGRILAVLPRLAEDARSEAAKIVVGLVGRNIGALEELLTSESFEVFRLAIARHVELLGVTPRVKALLTDGSAERRTAAAYALTKGLSDNIVEPLLVEFHNNSPYYYDVVAILDEHLYGPIEFKRFFPAK